MRIQRIGPVKMGREKVYVAAVKYLREKFEKSQQQMLLDQQCQIHKQQLGMIKVVQQQNSSPMTLFFCHTAMLLYCFYQCFVVKCVQLLIHNARI